ncbi:TM2 domain-containing protein [bacterium]|nr:TM2 domain-containing protein [bacterium]
MPLIDVRITQGDYWKGSGKGGGQVGYWVYIVFVCIFGILGLDHLLLRSPMTFLLKALTMIPLLGFWWLYDIAQATGEWELIKEHGIGIPIYGPMGIGKGIFINENSTNVSPPDIPRPWAFIAYVFFTMLFSMFPLNKIVVGDYMGAVAQLLMYFPGMLFFGIGVFLAMGWGLYDLYRIFFDTRGVLEKGVARIPPATWWPFKMDPYAKRASLGPLKNDPDTPTLLGKILALPGQAVDATGAAIKGVGEGVAAISKGTGQAVGAVAGATGEVVAGGITAVKGVTVDVVQAGAQAAQTTAAVAADTAKKVITTGGDVADAAGGVAIQGARAATNVVTLLPKIGAAMDAASKNQKGGAIIYGDASISSSVLLFSVGLLAACGYVMYAFRKTMDEARNDRQDDSPPDPSAVRKSSKADR